MVGEGNDGTADVGEKLDDVIRAGLCAKTAADAFPRIDVSYAVFNADGVLWADLCAVSQTDAAEGTAPAAAVKHMRRLA